MNDSILKQPALSGAYWVLPGRLLAGPYPCAADLPTAEQRVADLLACGVDFIVDLTEPGEYNLRPYWPILRRQAEVAARQIERWNSPIPDMSTPTAAQMREILARIDAAIADGHTVYVHCFGGIGRTGTVIGCHLMERGMEGNAALAEIERLRCGLPNAYRASPETDAQRRMVRMWKS
jgi:predicted protein tyrosine phosphatase